MSSAKLHTFRLAPSRDFLETRAVVLARAASEVEGLEGDWSREQRKALRAAANRLLALKHETIRALVTLDAEARRQADGRT